MSNKEKYDRQIRLWGVEGQKNIESAVICMIGSDGFSSEFLKNVALHAVGHIIIVDDAIVSQSDISSNFFIDQSQIGKPRAEAVAHLLNEMNSDPVITALVRPISDLSFLADQRLVPSTIVVTAGSYSSQYLAALSAEVRARHFRQVHIQATGFFGAFYMDAANHYFFEGGAESQHPNELRIVNPFDTLKAFFESFNLDTMPEPDHAHLSYPVILYHARKRLLSKLGIAELNPSHKQQLVDVIYSMKRGENEDELISEAVNNAASACHKPMIPIGTSEAFEICDKFGEDGGFWSLLKASKVFYQKHGEIPHYGGLPDLECSPDHFRELKRIYKEKSERDWAEVASMVPSAPKELVQRFSKNIWRLGGYSYAPVSEEIEKKPEEGYDDDGKNAAMVQLLFIAARHGGDMRREMEKLGASKEGLEEFINEFSRFQCPLPSVAATISSLAAQEVTKVIIQQGTPVKGILVYDGVHEVIKASE